jgi:trimethylamine:corrinoid methyltransferase-like protein
MGREDIVARAAERAEALLQEHQPIPRDEDADRAIDGLLQAAAREKGLRPTGAASAG